MVAYSFKRRFVVPIARGLGVSYPIDFIETVIDLPKRQTIRASGRRRHARPGETVQLYYGLRTKDCFMIGEGRCTSVRRIRIRFACAGRPQTDIKFGDTWNGPLRESISSKRASLDDFARADGFYNFQDMREFWKEHHPRVNDFDGVIVHWEPLDG